jgi:putative nucleotidyltransferase with HDIG domain
MTLRVSIPKGLLATELAFRSGDASEAELALVAKLESGRAALPVLPAVAASALQVANDPDADMARFSRLIETDPPIAARFLGVANSALYSRGRKITSVMDAVLRIGLYTARDLLFQAVYGASLRGLGIYQAEVESSFDRSVSCAILARNAGVVLRSSFREAYLCGLLHDIGESRVYRVLAELGVRVGADEARELVHRYHARAGEELAEKWKLPQEIIEVCSRHHEPGVPASEALRLVRIADWAVSIVQAQKDGAEPWVPSSEDTELLDLLSVSSVQARQIIERSVQELMGARIPTLSERSRSA